MTRPGHPPRNAYIPGKPLPWQLHAVGRPVTLFLPGPTEEWAVMEAGTVARVNVHDSGETITYDVRVLSGGTYREVTLGDLNNPQPNTFTYAP